MVCMLLDAVCVARGPAGQREVETQLAQLQSARGETEKLRQASEGTIAELRQALQQERDRGATVSEELASLRSVARSPSATLHWR